ncbi:hypothetical protein HZS_3395 [Henneguya salminicola]|nr:hypothetical protein HZS_3395 [Henneguya salminicola]
MTERDASDSEDAVSCSSIKAQSTSNTSNLTEKAQLYRCDTYNAADKRKNKLSLHGTISTPLQYLSTKKIKKDLKKWEKVRQNIDNYLKNKKAKLRNRVYRGIAPAYRGTLWSLFLNRSIKPTLASHVNKVQYRTIT